MGAGHGSSGDSHEDKLDEELLEELRELWQQAEEIWVEHQNRPEFRGYVSADYEAVFESLLKLRGRVQTFLEWGSGLGVVTMMASRLGFEAFGIESEGLLVDFSRTLAEQFAPQARFGQGTFIPDDFDWNPAAGDQTDGTTLGSQSAYEDLDMDLADFDLVYAYPWPEEHDLFRNIMRKCGGAHALFLSYDVREGTSLQRFRRR